VHRLFLNARTKVVLESGVLVVCYKLELAIGIKEKYQAYCIVYKAKDCICKSECIHTGVCGEVCFILYRGEEVE
jgi:uncharacterized protein YjaG (DUF416 family)